MAMSFPAKKVRLKIQEGLRKPSVIRGDDGWATLLVSSRHMDDYPTCRQVMQLLADLLHSSAPDTPEWEEDVLRVQQAFENYHDQDLQEFDEVFDAPYEDAV